MDKATDEKKIKEALDYHNLGGRPGKIEVQPTKPCISARDLSLAYTPGVAFPCLEIAKDPNAAYKYTTKGNLVGVISNGTAVLGLGNIGPLAGKPVMEGKGILFKRFADIDVFDIEVNEDTVEGMVRTVAALEPTFGGINLEDIKAPECFEIEQQLVEKMNIPVFHDDQHGTAIIASAGFINALEITKRDITKTKVVFSGAGAAAMSIAKLLFRLGVKPENLIMCDSKGVISKSRKDGMNKYKDEFAIDTPHKTLADAIKGADAFMGCSAKGALSKEMVATMGKNPIIFAMANPFPEILPHEVAEVRDDAIMATGRSDFPNQINNVLGFPFIFRGALDVRATKINEEMKLAAVHALANLAKESVPDEVKEAYGDQNFVFGKDYLIPKPFDKRVLTRVSPAVAKAAMDSGVARQPIEDMIEYARSLAARLGISGAFMRSLRARVRKNHKPRIVYPEATNSRMLKAINIINSENLIQPVLLGEEDIIAAKMRSLGVEHLMDKVEIMTPEKSQLLEPFTEKLYEQTQRKGIGKKYAAQLMVRKNYFGCMLVKEGHADALVTGATQNYPECIKPIMRIVGTNNKRRAAGIIILILRNKVIFLADCTLQITPTAKELADIAISTATLYKSLMLKEPRVAFLSFSNFGSNSHPEATVVKNAVEITRSLSPELKVDGEMQADVAVNYQLQSKFFGFSNLDRSADVLIFPTLNAANISYKLLTQLSDAHPIGPILVPLDHAVNIIQRTATVDEIVNMSTLMAAISQEKKKVLG